MKQESNPVEILKEDHDKVKQLFEKFEAAEESTEKEEIVKQAIMELKVHTSIEEEIFYPAAREKLAAGDEANEDLLDEALEEHHAVKLLIEELNDMSAETERYDAKFTVLAENVKHHIKEEESELFPQIEGSDNDWQEIGQKLMDRKQELQAKMQEGNSSRRSKSSSGRVPSRQSRKKAA